jgi:hypothetical protein
MSDTAGARGGLLNSLDWPWAKEVLDGLSAGLEANLRGANI